MGWNDRLPEDPFIPYENQKDRDDYEAWHAYVESCRLEKEGGLTSQNVTPDRLEENEESVIPQTPRVDIVPRQKEDSAPL